MSRRQITGVTRHILDHLNHDDLVDGEGGGGIPEPPGSGHLYGRGMGEWHPVLSLSGGQLQGPLVTQMGSMSAPGLMIGSNDSGFWRGGTVIYLMASFGYAMAWTPTLIASWLPLNMGNQLITGLADASYDTDALNRRVADARYVRRTDPESPAGAWQNFTAGVGWTNSTLRYRMVPAGLQFEGTAVNLQPLNSTIALGTLPIGYRVARQQVMVTALTGAGGYGFGYLIFNVNGEILVWYGIAGNQIYPSGIIALD